MQKFNNFISANVVQCYGVCKDPLCIGMCCQTKQTKTDELKQTPRTFVITYYASIFTCFCLVIAYYKNGSLLSYLRSNKVLTFERSLSILKGIAAGMAHLHKENVVHRDLAARNVLV